jgi:hypothetical protein
MVKTLLISLALVFIVVLLLGIRVFFVKGGKFPNTHIGGNKAMKERGIMCAKSQDLVMYAKKESPVEREMKSNNSQIT